MRIKLDNRAKMPTRAEELSGQRFGKLTVVERMYTNSPRAFWLCECECGNTTTARADHLKSGRTTSCGCIRTKHGDKRRGKTERLYRIWCAMKNRCYEKSYRQFKNYGGRGITVCEEWKNYAVFKEWSFANGYRDELSIDRIDVNGNYEPSNCRWATQEEQANNKRQNRRETFNGETHTVAEWAKIYGVKYSTLRSRLNRDKLPIEEALKRR